MMGVGQQRAAWMGGGVFILLVVYQEKLLMYLFVYRTSFAASSTIECFLLAKHEGWLLVV